MNFDIHIEDKELQAFGYQTLIVLVRPDPKTYNQWIAFGTDTNDTTSDIILDDLLKKYAGAWKKLAEM